MSDEQVRGQILMLRAMVGRLYSYVALHAAAADLKPSPEAFLHDEGDELARLRYVSHGSPSAALEVQKAMGEALTEVLRVAEASLPERRQT